jgi:hypothetical protein
MTPVVTAPENNRNFFVLKPLLDEVDEELVMCPQMKLSKPVFQHVTANETYPFRLNSVEIQRAVTRVVK